MAKIPSYFSQLIKKEHAAVAASLLDAKKNTVISTDSYTLDWATKGGIARGELTLFWGTPGCLSGDTLIAYSSHDKTGARKTQKTITLKKLYEKFNKLQPKGKGIYQRKQSVDYTLMINSVDDDGLIIKNEIEGVVYSGVKECFEVITVSGLRIVATADHKFFTGEKYVPLSELQVGSTVCVHQNTRFTGDDTKKATRNRYKEVLVKYHPSERYKTVEQNGKSYTYCRIRESRLAVEAQLNSMSTATFRLCLNTMSPEEINSMVWLPSNINVHHINEDWTDNRIENLMLIRHEDHARQHCNPNRAKWVITDDEIASIRGIGEIDTYDIQCRAPYNNFVANGFVVHNSGKTTLMLKQMAKELQAHPEKVAIFIDTEYSFDAQRAQQLGVDVERVIVLQGNTFEGAIAPLAKTANEIITDKSVCFIGLDSVKGFQSINEQSAMNEGAVDSAANAYGGISKSINPAVKILLRIAAETGCMVILSNHANMNMDPRSAKYYPYLLTGGQTLKHLCSTTIFFDKVDSKKSKLFAADVTSVNKTEVAIGSLVRCKVTKSRRTVEGKVAEVVWNLETGEFEKKEEELLRLAESLNVVWVEGKGRTMFMGPKDGTCTKLASSRADVVTRLSNEPNLVAKLWNLCLDVKYNPSLSVNTETIDTDASESQ